MPELRTFLQQANALHKHLCPRQVLGVRTGMYAAELLELDLPQQDKRLFAFVETDGCFSDGVSVATGCWLGHRTLRLADYGKVAATFVDTRTGQALRIWPNPAARELAASYAPGAPDHWTAQFEGYQVMPTSELLLAEPVRLSVSIESIVSRPGLRVACARCGEDVMNEREVLLAGVILCRRCAGLDSYYDPVCPSPPDVNCDT